MQTNSDFKDIGLKFIGEQDNLKTPSLFREGPLLTLDAMVGVIGQRWQGGEVTPELVSLHFLSVLITSIFSFEWHNIIF